MNTCCESQTHEVTQSEATATPVRYVQPQWSARRNQEGVSLEITIPGVKREDLKLEAQGSQLLLEARRPSPEADGKLLYGPAAPEGYRLKLRIAETLDTAKLTARLNDGILQVGIPLIEAAQPKRIDIL